VTDESPATQNQPESGAQLAEVPFGICKACAGPIHLGLWLCGITADWEVRCHPAAAPLFEIFRTDPGQSAELASFIHNCRPGMRLLDAGAHFGFFALAALRYGGKDARVLCVEASPGAVKVLKENLRSKPGRNPGIRHQ
jgi:hypothetical protein